MCTVVIFVGRRDADVVEEVEVDCRSCRTGEWRALGGGELSDSSATEHAISRIIELQKYHVGKNNRDSSLIEA